MRALRPLPLLLVRWLLGAAAVVALAVGALALDRTAASVGAALAFAWVMQTDGARESSS